MNDYSHYGMNGLREEAERRVRAGESRAEVSRLLGVPLTTLSQWALAGGWRKKDLARECARELAERTAFRISGAHAVSLAEAVRRAEVEEVLAASALEDTRMLMEATRRLEAARLMLAEARRSQMTAINAAYGYGPEPEDGGVAQPLVAAPEAEQGEAEDAGAT